MEPVAKILFSRLSKLSASAALQSRNYAHYGGVATAKLDLVDSTPPNRRTECDFNELVALMSYDDVALIDVRTDKELLQQGSIPGAIHIPLGELKTALQMTEANFVSFFFQRKPSKKDRNLIFFARGPNASSAAMEIAHKLGYKGSRHYSGGWEDYCKRQGIPLQKNQTTQESSANTSNVSLINAYSSGTRMSSSYNNKFYL